MSSTPRTPHHDTATGTPVADELIAPPLVNPPVAEPVVADTPSDVPRPRRTRLLGLDGPRGVACMGVLVVHVAGHYSPSTLEKYHVDLVGQGVTFFFVLSGFLLFLPFARALVSDKAMPATRAYALHRVFRIFPAYLLIFLIVNFAMRAAYLRNAAEVTVPGQDRGMGMITDPLELLLNLTLTQSFVPRYLQTGINPSWSLTTELCFYVSLPIVGVLLHRIHHRFRTSPALLMIAAGVVYIVVGTLGKGVAGLLESTAGTDSPALLTWGPNWAAVTNRSFLGLADTFGFGIIAAGIFVLVERVPRPGWMVRRMRHVIAVAAIVVLPVGLLTIALHLKIQSSLVALASAMLILFIIAPLGRGEESRFARWADWTPLRFLGEVSLSIYLWHFPVLIVLGRLGWVRGDTVSGMLINSVLVGAVSVVLAAATYRFVELPAVNYARRFKSGRR
ncbi:acyltransferase family protein [Williamsia sterculiae]|uniref:Peptidoglycan/LPS O-acetylase OafA/YrhL, contains acyltransferase and SGNH-hydrolase domains n=1 Tax=Williamsia sterculiae TaxID=1344003 RepID=A0A1N7D0D0_9NOCA|nr:acyltransferase [Williamsia sterculiae]SIR69155.1 Peptidoglycan/LPS O-acetylase OafA/YrhL, contains acyltransferase and SGNH-hydrolase domains [Williamsia sterculiae]